MPEKEQALKAAREAGHDPTPWQWSTERERWESRCRKCGAVAVFAYRARHVATDCPH